MHLFKEKHIRHCRTLETNNTNLEKGKKKKETKKFVNLTFKDKIKKLSSDINHNSRVFFCTYRRIDMEEIVEEQLEKVDEKVAKPKSKKKKIWSIISLLLNVSLVILVFYNFAKEQGGIQPLSTLFANHPKWMFLWIALGLYFVTVLFNTFKFSFLIKNRTGKFRFWFSLKLATIGRYYDLVTPLGTGGQPFEIYYLKKNGYSGDTATAIPLAKYMIWQISFSVLCLVILILYSSKISSPLVLVMACVGLSITLALFLFVFFMSITKKFGASLVVAVLKLLHKCKIIKNYKVVLVKVLKFVKSYQVCIKSFAKNPFTVIMEIVVTLGSLIANSLIAYFILIAFVEVPSMSWWDIVCYCMICEVAVSFWPLPGGSGAQELSFNALLGSLFPEGTLFWGILIWRICTYYLYIVQGGVVFIIDAISQKHGKIATIPNLEIPQKHSKISTVNTTLDTNAEKEKTANNSQITSINE